MKKLFFTLLIALSSSLFTLCEAQYRVLHYFGSIPGDGSTPYGSLTLMDGKLYGMSRYGGASNNGCIFSIDTNGADYKTIFSFDSVNGSEPWGNLTLIGNTLYGMVDGGGAYNRGCIFSIDTDGNGFRDIFDFNGTNGDVPLGSLIFVKNKLYGMTLGGGYGVGVVFSVDTNGNNYKVLLKFNTNNGESPQGSLIYAAGVLYGMTQSGGNGPDYGTVFSIDTDGTNFHELYEFPGPAWPRGSLTRAGNKLYGMTSQGGHSLYSVSPGFGNIFSIDTDGNNCKEIYGFIATTGMSPYGSLTLLMGDALYGMTMYGGMDGCGTIFKIDTNGGGLVTFYDFPDCDSIGGAPWGDVTISGNMLYGMTSGGGINNSGVIFSFNYVTAGINNLTANNASIKVYPNPSNGVFTLQSSVVSDQSSVEVYNVLGEKVYSQFSTLHSPLSINLSNQPNGIYLYRLISETGQMIGEGKLVIEK